MICTEYGERQLGPTTPSMSRCLVQVVELTAVRAVTDDPG